MKKLFLILLSLLFVIIVLLFILESKEQNESQPLDSSLETTTGTLQMTFLDIGQGDATFIVFPDGRQMLVDCAIDARILEALGRVMPYYDRTLDYLVVTHPDLDHYGGCVDVIKRFEIGNIIYNGYMKDQSDMWQTFWEAAHAEGNAYYELAQPETWEIASTTVHFLYPDHSIARNPNVPGHEKDTGSNNSSIILKLTYGNVDTLLLADSEAELEEYLVESYPDILDVEVLKAGHHGSAGSSIPEMIEKTTPLHTIFSAGLGNKFGHPSLRVIRRVERVGSEVWRTDTQGDILVKTDGEELDVETLK